MTVRFYEPERLVEIAEFYKGLKDLVEKFEGPPFGDNEGHALYVFSMEVVIRHKDDYTVGRIYQEDDNLVYETTDERYGESPKQ